MLDIVLNVYYEDAVLTQPFQMIRQEENYATINKHPNFPAITEELSVSNYREKFHNLLHWEELQHIEDLKNRYVYVCVHAYSRVYVHMHVCVCMHACMCMYVCV